MCFIFYSRAPQAAAMPGDPKDFRSQQGVQDHVLLRAQTVWLCVLPKAGEGASLSYLNEIVSGGVRSPGSMQLSLRGHSSALH